MIPPEYFRTRFRAEDPAPAWPPAFVIVSAWATTGERWNEEQNRAADEALRARLDGLGVWHHRVTGYDGEGEHAEPSFAAELPLGDAIELAVEFRQLGVFEVRDGECWIVMCGEPREEALLAQFLDRLDDGFG